MPREEATTTRGVVVPMEVFVEIIVATGGYRHLLGVCGFSGNEDGRRIIAEADLLVGTLDDILFNYSPPKGD